MSSLPSIPPSIPSLIQTDLILLNRLANRNAAQHRSALFFRRVIEIQRLGKLVLRSILVVREGTAGTGDVKRLKVLIKKFLPALTKSTSSVSQMIFHLHFLPFTTSLLSIYSRLWVLTLNIKACLLAWEENRLGDGERDMKNTKLGVSNKRDLTELEVIQAGSKSIDSSLRIGRQDRSRSHMDKQTRKVGKRTNGNEGVILETRNEDLELDLGTWIERSKELDVVESDKDSRTGMVVRFEIEKEEREQEEKKTEGMREGNDGGIWNGNGIETTFERRKGKGKVGEGIGGMGEGMRNVEVVRGDDVEVSNLEMNQSTISTTQDPLINLSSSTSSIPIALTPTSTASTPAPTSTSSNTKTKTKSKPSSIKRSKKKKSQMDDIFGSF